MSNILDTIVKRKKEEVLLRKQLVSEAELLKITSFGRKCFSFSDHITNPNLSGIIAEFKRKSPSKPTINLNADVVKITTAYRKAKASAISVLTDIDFFGGSDEDLILARANNSIPILRKDFMVDAYQIIEAKSLGADAILLIAEILTKSEVDSLSKLAVECGMEVLLEIHTVDQIEKYHERINTIGVNNRNLKTFTTDIQYSKDIFPHLPKDVVKISESGIDHASVVLDLKKTGYQGFLIGENFMKTKNPELAIQTFVHQLNDE
jgi:indole-3-glycerol phosphate synthase